MAYDVEEPKIQKVKWVKSKAHRIFQEEHMLQSTFINMVQTHSLRKVASLFIYVYLSKGLPSIVENNPLPMQETQETQVQSLGWEDPLEKEMATHSSILAWEIPWAEESGEL